MGFLPLLSTITLIRWARWWVGISASWQLQIILQQFIDCCWNIQVSAVAMTLISVETTLHDMKADCRVLAQVQTGLQEFA